MPVASGTAANTTQNKVFVVFKASWTHNYTTHWAKVGQAISLDNGAWQLAGSSSWPSYNSAYNSCHWALLVYNYDPNWTHGNIDDYTGSLLLSITGNLSN